MLGIPLRLDQPCACPLPGHGDHTASLVPISESFQVKCSTLGHTFTLAHVRAARAYVGVVEDPVARGLSRLLLARWAELLDHEAGILEPQPVELALPADLSPTARLMGERIRLFLGLRATSPKWCTAEFTFARSFARAYCELGDRQARDAMAELRTRGVLRAVGTSDRARREPIVYVSAGWPDGTRVPSASEAVTA